MSLSRKCLLLIICLVLLGMADAVAAPDSSGKPQPQAQPDIAQLQRSIVPDRQNTVPGLVLQDKMPLVPYLEYYIDSSYALDITEASSEQLRDKYELFAPERMPVYGTPGITWLRFVLQPVSEGTQTQAILLDMGSSTPGTPILYTPSFANGALEWQEIQPKGNYFELPRQSAQPIVCYLRVDGIPGFWFSPVLRTVADALSASDSIALYQQSPLVVLAVVFILCLFKGLVEPGQWRLWALLFLAACSVQAWSGLAPATGGYSAKTLASLTTAGLALMLWPHVARHFLHSREVSRALDVQLILLCLPGAAATLLPLVPNFQWIARLTQVWPLAMVIFIPSAVWGCVVGARSSVRFLMATTIPPLATAAGLLGLRSGFDPELLAALPHLGVGLGALVLLAMGQKEEPQINMAASFASPATALATSPSLSLDMAPSSETILLGEPEPVGSENIEERPKEEPQGEQTLYSSILNPLRNVQNVLTDFVGKDDFPSSCHKSSRDLLQAAQALADELVQLEENDARARENARKMSVIAVSGNTAFLAVLSHVLRRHDCYIRDADSMQDAIALTRELPAKMYVFEGAFASASVAKDLETITKLCDKQGWSPLLLAYTEDDSTWGDLGNAGFTHALPLPIDDQALINTLEEFEQDLAGEGQREADAQSDVTELGAPVETALKEEESEIPDLFGMGAPSGGKPQGSASLKARLVQSASLARSAFMRNDMNEVVRQTSLIAEYSKDVQPVARMAGLVLQAAKSGDRTAVRDLLLQLASSIETRFKG